MNGRKSMFQKGGKPMSVKFSQLRGTPRVSFAPGDQVIRYVNAQPFFCTVIEVQPDEQIRVNCSLWPSGYSAIVRPQEVALLARSGLAA
jgi:hypothetical protein